MRISDWSSDVCSSDLPLDLGRVVEIGAGGVEMGERDAEPVHALRAPGRQARILVADPARIAQDLRKPQVAPEIIVLILLEDRRDIGARRSEEHTSELQSLMRHSYAVLCLKKKR